MYQFMQLRSKRKNGSFFPAGHLWSECFLLYLCLAKYKAKDVTLNILYCWGLKLFLVQKLELSAFVESLTAVGFFAFLQTQLV